MHRGCFVSFFNKVWKQNATTNRFCEQVRVLELPALYEPHLQQARRHRLEIFAVKSGSFHLGNKASMLIPPLAYIWNPRGLHCMRFDRFLQHEIWGHVCTRMLFSSWLRHHRFLKMENASHKGTTNCDKTVYRSLLEIVPGLHDEKPMLKTEGNYLVS
jgi:hypothetical protein